MNDGCWYTSYILRRKLDYKYHGWAWSNILIFLYSNTNLFERTDANKICFHSVTKGKFAYRLKQPVATQCSLLDTLNIPQRITREQLLEGLKEEFEKRKNSDVLDLIEMIDKIFLKHKV